jgi:cell division protein FtsI/penicillin-binding protein 2
MPARVQRRVAVASAACLVLLAGCTDDAPETPDPEPVAESLAAGLADLDLTDVPTNSEAAGRQLAAAVEPLGDLRPTVTVDSVATEASGEDGATQSTAWAALRYEWDLDADSEPDWTYQTTARLDLVEDAWQVRWQPDVLAPELVAGERLVVSGTSAERADILGADGAVLVTERPVFRVGIDRTQVGPSRLEASARALAQALDIEVPAYVERVAGSGLEAFVEAIVYRKHDVSEPLRQAVGRIRGAVLLPDQLPLAPSREFARALLGTVGEPTAEMIEESDGRLAIGDLAGLSGLQERYDEALAGRPGLVVEARTDEDSRALHEEPATPGTPVRTTLDPGLQALAERVLLPVGPASAIVAVRAADGHVLAAASGPGSEGLSTATDGRYAPGSTFKVATALALLRSGLSPDSTVSCTPTATVEGKEFGNYSDYPADDLGPIPLRTAVASSCNTAFVSEADRVPQAELAAAAASLGLGVDQDLGAPAFLGSVPPDSTGTEHAASMIGQGRVEASPLAMATVAASVAAGETVVPRLVLEPQTAPEAEPEQPLSGAEAEQLAALMRGVVTDGSGSFLADVPGPPVGAKTGTAEYGTETPLRTHVWMIAAQGDLGVAVMVADGESGSQTAGPLLEAFLRGAAR